jgi:hypothetical protein
MLDVDAQVVAGQRGDTRRQMFGFVVGRGVAPPLPEAEADELRGQQDDDHNRSGAMTLKPRHGSRPGIVECLAAPRHHPLSRCHAITGDADRRDSPSILVTHAVRGRGPRPALYTGRAAPRGRAAAPSAVMRHRRPTGPGRRVARVSRRRSGKEPAAFPRGPQDGPRVALDIAREPCSPLPVVDQLRWGSSDLAM